MISTIDKFPRIYKGVGLVLILFLAGILTMGDNIEFTGTMFMFAALLVLAYLPLFSLVSKYRPGPHIESWTNNELWALAILLGLLSLLGISESFPDNMMMGFIFLISLIAILVFSYYQFKDHHLAFPFWLYFLGLALVLVSLEDDFPDHEGYAIFGLCYFLFLAFLIARWFFNQVKSVINLNNERKKSELMQLQSQVNPHFFFNMLNNLYGLVAKDSQKAQELILKLSDMMRYSIYEGQKELVTLEEEADYLKNYIELHQMRYRKKIEIVFNQQIENSGLKIMPLMFIILVENAFKHGVENLRENAYVQVELRAKDNKISFKVENNFDAAEIPKKSGIGISNLKRRLELVYTKKHELLLSTQDSIYTAELNLIL